MNNQLSLEEQTTLLLAPPETGVIQKWQPESALRWLLTITRKMTCWSGLAIIVSCVQHELYATARQDGLLSDELQTPVVRLQSGPLGGDQQIGARIAEGEIDLLIFFWIHSHRTPRPGCESPAAHRGRLEHPVACDRATADYVISSQLMNEPYERILPDYASHIDRLDGVDIVDIHEHISL